MPIVTFHDVHFAAEMPSIKSHYGLPDAAMPLVKTYGGPCDCETGLVKTDDANPDAATRLVKIHNGHDDRLTRPVATHDALWEHSVALGGFAAFPGGGSKAIRGKIGLDAEFKSRIVSSHET